jgi:hypothetical protein
MGGLVGSRVTIGMLLFIAREIYVPRLCHGRITTLVSPFVEAG